MKLFSCIFGVDNHKNIVDLDGVNATYNKQEGYIDGVCICLAHYPYGSACNKKGEITLRMSKGIHHFMTYLPPSPKAVKEAIHRFRFIFGV